MADEAELTAAPTETATPPPAVADGAAAPAAPVEAKPPEPTPEDKAAAKARRASEHIARVANKERELERERAEVAALKTKLQRYDEIIAKRDEDPEAILNLLDELDISMEQYVDHVAAKNRRLSPDEQAAVDLKTRLDKLEAAQKAEADAKAKAEAEARAKADEERAAAKVTEIGEHAKKDAARWELVNKLPDGAKQAFEVMVAHWKLTAETDAEGKVTKAGELLSFDEALDALEEELAEAGKVYGYVKQPKGAPAPAAEAVTPATEAPTDEEAGLKAVFRPRGISPALASGGAPIVGSAKPPRDAREAWTNALRLLP